MGAPIYQGTEIATTLGPPVNVTRDTPPVYSVVEVQLSSGKLGYLVKRFWHGTVEYGLGSIGCGWYRTPQQCTVWSTTAEGAHYYITQLGDSITGVVREVAHV